MNSKIQNVIFFFLGALCMYVCMYFYYNYKIEKKNTVDSAIVYHQNKEIASNNTSYSNTSSEDISQLTQEDLVIEYIKNHHQLPDYYLTKSEAKKMGWVPSSGNLCDVLPGRAIGGDNFTNREGTLPRENNYYEADVNYNCGNRNADRLVFTKDGEVWVTHNHYKSFDKK